MKFDVFKFALSHIKNELRIGHKYVATTFVGSHFLVLAILEFRQRFRVVALNPAGFVHLHRFEPALGIIFVFQPILNNLKLKLSNGSDDTATIKLTGEKLGNTFVH